MKKHIFYSSSLILIVSLLLGCKGEKKETDTSMINDKLEEFVNQIEDENTAIGSISIFRQDKEIYQRSFGFSDVEQSKKADNNTKYRIGSITKTFTAAVILQLIEEEKLSLKTHLSDFYPGIPNAEKITIEHLLKHRSGLFNITELEDFESMKTTPQTEKTLITRIKSFDVLFEPNLKTSYSNTNYIMLSLIAEKLENMTYAKILEKRIIRPNQLSNTYFGGKIRREKNEAFSYARENDSWIKFSETDMSIPRGAGGIVSTPTDLNSFYFKLFNKDILSDSLMTKMIDIKEGWGMGLSQLPYPNRKAYGHPGSIDGFNSITVYFPEEKVTVSYLSNGQAAPIQQIFFPILNIYFESMESAKK